MKDRDIKFGKNTIMWNQIALRLRAEGSNTDRILSLVDYLNLNAWDKNSKPLHDLSYLGRSLIKLQALGVIQTDFISTLGTTSLNNINRIHITVTGQEILKYIARTQEEEK